MVRSLALFDQKFPIEGASAARKDWLRGVSAGSNVPYHIVANDLEGVNFSSGRLGENKWHDTCKTLQEHIIENLVRCHFNTWLSICNPKRSSKASHLTLGENTRCC